MKSSFLYATVALLLSSNVFAEELNPNQSFYDILQSGKELSAKMVDSATCATSLSEYYKKIVSIDPTTVNKDELRPKYQDVVKYLFQTRLSVRHQFAALVHSESQKAEFQTCVAQVRNVFRANRYLEDYIGELFLQPKRFDPKVDQKSVNTLQGSAPHLLLAPDQEGWTVKSGDVLISRGNAFTSAAISRVGDVDAQFSHAAFIYIKGPDANKTLTPAEAIKNPNVLVLEAHIEVGSTIRTFAEYLSDGNARTALFRYSDFDVAHRAAEHTYNYITKRVQQAFEADGGMFEQNDVNYHIPYDFAMDASNADELFCSEVPYIGFKSQGLTLPLFSTVVAKNNDLIARLGIKVPKIFAPGDMELETRFEYLAEFRDYRKVAGLRYKDATLTAMFDFMENKNYRIQPSLGQSTKALFGWLLRQLDIRSTKEKLPKNMNKKVLSSVFVLDYVGAYMQALLVNKETAYVKKHGVYLGLPDMLKELELYRQRDLRNYLRGTSDFHNYLRPSDQDLQAVNNGL